jgi:hypothetical protein
MSHPVSRYRIVQRTHVRRWPWLLGLGAAWLLSVLLAWLAAIAYAAPELVEVGTRLRAAESALRQEQARARQLDQRQATLARSDLISRDANRDLQGSLAERDEEIAALRADVAFYERLVGPTQQQRKGLNVFSSEFVAGSKSAWHYQIVLTQNLNRGAISQGRMRFKVEGVQDGKLATVDWDQLHQRPDASGQAYSFRYFQALEGSVMLPPGFTPQRVKVHLAAEGEHSDGVAVEQELDWKTGAT